MFLLPALVIEPTQKISRIFPFLLKVLKKNRVKPFSRKVYFSSLHHIKRTNKKKLLFAHASNILRIDCQVLRSVKTYVSHMEQAGQTVAKCSKYRMLLSPIPIVPLFFFSLKKYTHFHGPTFSITQGEWRSISQGCICICALNEAGMGFMHTWQAYEWNLHLTFQYLALQF